MKANELRIGNWYIYHDSAFIMDCESLLETLDDADVESAIDDIEPIPLTEEWLLKFGFEKNYPTRVNNEWQFKAFYSLGGITLIQYVDDSFAIDIDECKVPLEYVHQLQNLYFALTGEELTITKQ